jgi:signal transduction histidine kinase
VLVTRTGGWKRTSPGRETSRTWSTRPFARANAEIPTRPASSTGLPALVERIQATGLPVHLTIDGSPPALPAGVELSAYRIVQEALTNTLKHAGPGTEATVRLTLHPDHVDVEVADDGAGPPAHQSATHGNGLRGIAERVDLLGGTLSLGPGPGGGFAMRAHLPVAPTGVPQ